MERKRILIIDDEEEFCRIVKMNLEWSSEFQVAIATSGRQGIQMVKEDHPDLILLDVLMPEMDGGTVAGILLEDARTKDIPVIFLTALVKKEESGGGIGSHYFLAKPISAEELLRHIRKFI